MGKPTTHPPALLIVAAFSRYRAALAWARDRAVDAWGSVAIESPVFSFTQTDYYTATMGPDLQKTFFVFTRPFDPADLANIKLKTNRWEEQYAALADVPEERPLNLDPGYLTPAKLVLASTKDHSHRIYVGRGIYAEVTLYYKNRCWQSREWTYADYRRPDYQQFFSQCRELIRRRQRKEATT